MTKENIVDKFRLTKHPDQRQVSFTICILKVQLLNNRLYDNLPPFREKDGNCYYEFYVKNEADAFYDCVSAMLPEDSIHKLYS